MVVLNFINSASAKIISFLKISLCDLCQEFNRLYDLFFIINISVTLETFINVV